jgi:hypothetical protein
MLDILPEPGEWQGSLKIYESSPGAGKTTIFKLLTPGPLKRLATVGERNDNLQDLLNRLQGLDIIDEDEKNPKVMGAYLPCERNFAALEDLELSEPESIRLFNALINARITLSTLRAFSEFYDLNYPGELNELKIEVPDDMMRITDMESESTSDGESLFKWASETESGVYDALDSFVTDPKIDVSGNDHLHALSLMEPGNIQYEGNYPPNTLLLLDNAQELTNSQRRHLNKKVTNYRANVDMWVAQRLEALDAEDLIPNARQGRDYDIINIENYWKSNRTKFTKLLKEIGDRRCQHAKGVEINSFTSQLENNLNDTKWEVTLQTAREKIKERIREKTENTNKFEEWIEEVQAKESSRNTLEETIHWRALEVEIDRKLRGAQRQLSVGVSIRENPDLSPDSSVRNAAQKLLTEEFESLPYYYGYDTISYLSSLNIDQYLSISGDLFEEISSRYLLDDQSPLPPEEQDKIIREWADSKWEEIPRSVPYGREVQGFLQSIGEMCRENWEKKTASYGGAGAVTGIGIRYPEVDKILGKKQNGYDRIDRLQDVLTTCLANNLIEARPKSKQGKKGQEVLILYLNRWVCVKFNLPLKYGGWRERKARELEDYITKERIA